jgi:hypothetical protein
MHILRRLCAIQLRFGTPGQSLLLPASVPPSTTKYDIPVPFAGIRSLSLAAF